MKNKRIMQNKGITLIALVITIIILLILAGISLQALTNTGLFEKAEEAKKRTENAQADEYAKLNEYEQEIANYLGEGSSGGGGPSGGGSSGEGEKKITDTGETKPSQAMPENSTVIENDFSKGIVIKDSSDNEWTWVVVPKSIYSDPQYTASNENKNVTSETDYDGIYNILNAYASTYREGGLGQRRYWKDEWYEGCGIEATENKTGEEVYIEMYNKMLSSVFTNGGFWISRYEAGVANSNTDTTNETIPNVRYSHSNITSESPKAVSQANRIPYNFVYCSEAQRLANAMLTDSSKTSSLLFGIQWDLVCKYLEVNAFNGTSSELNNNSKNWGNCLDSSLTLKEGSRYCTSPREPLGVWALFNVTGDFVQLTGNSYKTNSSTRYSGLLTTGASEDANKMNIYDFAGNSYEWTLEHSTVEYFPCSRRGGYFYYEGMYAVASSRLNTDIDVADYFTSFRTAIY